MSEHHPRRGRNWYSAMGVLFVVVGAIVMVQNLLIWNEFVLDFILNSEITNEKISLGMFAFGGFMILLGFRKKYA
jgi:hypothetical protein